MTTDARNLWVWVTECVDNPACWCPPGKITGPQYPIKVTLETWKEVQTDHHNQTVFVDRQYIYKLLDGQAKGDGRGAQGNVQLRLPNDQALYMNLHVPLIRKEIVVTPADDGGADWNTIVKHSFKKKNKK